MKYDFTTVHDRSREGSNKWSKMKQIVPDLPDGIVPFSTADMEFAAIPQISSALSKYAASAIFGYTAATDEYYAAVVNWMKKRHGWEIGKDEIVITAGVVPAICMAVRAFSKPGDGILMLTPVYFPFYKAAESNGRRIVGSPLIRENGTYRIDFDDLEKKASQKDVPILILCSPHNPVGRVWTKAELERILDICVRNDVLIICDEIHHDIIMPGCTHTVLAGISEEAAQRTITCTAPSKTFNLAGLCSSNIVIRNPELRERFKTEKMRDFAPNINCFGYIAGQTAYAECEDWLDEAITVIDANRQLAEDFIRERIPEIVPYKLEGTYLLWLDCRALGLDRQKLEDFMRREAFIFTDEGYEFGAGGEGFERINIACPTNVLRDALERLEKAVRKIR